ncbi:MAG: pseudouridine synthase [Bacteroidota bacterium]
MENRCFILNKPYNMLSQFVSPYAHHRLLGDIDFQFPQGTHAIGRLDEFSEGLLILTTDKSITRRLLHPDKQHNRHYVVQVQRVMSETTLQQLRDGIGIQLKQRGDYTTMPCEVNKISRPENLAFIDKAYLDRIEHTWLEFILTEGKNRQIRKMCKVVKHNCKRLIRTKIENLNLGDLKAGQVKELKAEDFFNQLGLE